MQKSTCTVDQPCFSNLDFHAQKTGNQQRWQKMTNYNRLTAWN